MPDITRREALLVTVGFCFRWCPGIGDCGRPRLDDQPTPDARKKRPRRSDTAESSLRELAAVETIPDGGALDVSAAADEPRVPHSYRRLGSGQCRDLHAAAVWSPGKRSRRFECPCHRGAYDAEAASSAGHHHDR